MNRSIFEKIQESAKILNIDLYAAELAGYTMEQEFSREMLEAIENVSTIALSIVLVFLIVNRLYEDRWVEVYLGTRQTTGAVRSEVYRRKRPVWTIALTNHRNTSVTARVGIEPICLLASRTVGCHYQIRGIHSVPLSIDIPREDRTFVTPLCEVFNRC